MTAFDQRQTADFEDGESSSCNVGEEPTSLFVQVMNDQPSGGRNGVVQREQVVAYGDDASFDGGDEPEGSEEPIPAPREVKKEALPPAGAAPGEEPRPALPAAAEPGREPRPALPPAAEPRREPRPAPPPAVELEARPAPPEVIREQPAQAEAVVPGLNPKFKDLTLEQVQERAEASVSLVEGKELYEELIKRYDMVLDKDATREFFQSAPIIALALKQGKEIVPDKEGKPVLGDANLTAEQKYDYHRALLGDMQVLTSQVGVRQNYATFLRQHGQFKDAVDWTKQARDKADALPIQLMKGESEQLSADMANEPNAAKRQSMQSAVLFLQGENADSGAIKMPINTRKVLAQLYLGTEIEVQDGIPRVRFGQNSGFKPDLAYDVAKEVAAKTQEILGFDPLDPANQARFSDVGSLFGAVKEVFADPDKYNIFNVVEAHKAENIKRELRESSKTESIVLDIGVVAFVSLTLALSRNPKVAAAAERLLGRAGPTLAKAGGYAVAAVGAPTLRHYGYEMLTGTPESWADTGVHVVGSLAAAEVGSRLLGRGSLIFQTAGEGPALFRQFNKETAASWYAEHGFDTTGKMAELMARNGFAREARILGALEATTPITSQLGLGAVESANLIHARLGTVAKAIGADLKGLSGIDQAKLAQALGKGGMGTIDDLAKFIEKDNKAMEEIAKHSSEMSGGASVHEAVRGVDPTRQLALIETAERLGVTTVRQVRALARAPRSMEKLFPNLHELTRRGVVSGSDSLGTAASAGNRVFEGRGLEALIGSIPPFERGALLSASSIQKLASGSRGLTQIEKAIADSGNTFHTFTNASEAGLGAVSTQTLSRTRWLTAMLGSAGTVGTYNSTVKAWDMHNLSQKPDGSSYTFLEALKEANLPTVNSGIHPIVDHAFSAMIGTPGQALVGAFLLRPGAIARENQGIFSRVFNSTPLSHQAWTNLNANLLSKPGMGGVAALGGVLSKSVVESTLDDSPKKAQYRKLLENMQAPIENLPPREK